MTTNPPDPGSVAAAETSVLMSIGLRRFLDMGPETPAHTKVTGDLRAALVALETFFEAEAIYPAGDPERAEAVEAVTAAMQKLLIFLLAMAKLIRNEFEARAEAEREPPSQ